MVIFKILIKALSVAEAQAANWQPPTIKKHVRDFGCFFGKVCVIGIARTLISK